MRNKKIVFIFVEGPSDDTALGYFFSKFYDPDEVYVHVEHGDITTDPKYDSGTIVGAIGNVIKNYLEHTKFKESDIAQVIHITDTDGVFIANDSVISDVTYESPYYTPDCILAPNPRGIIYRNSKKSNNLIRLSLTNKMLKSIPYSIFFMSCNLEHILFDDQNCPDDKKEDKAWEFVEKYSDDLEGFISFVCNSSFSLTGTYKETWNFIRKENNSLRRYTNISLCFNNK